MIDEWMHLEIELGAEAYTMTFCAGEVVVDAIDIVYTKELENVVDTHIGFHIGS